MKIDSNSTFLDFANSKIEIKVKAKPLSRIRKMEASFFAYVPKNFLSIQEFVKSRCNFLPSKAN